MLAVDVGMIEEVSAGVEEVSVGVDDSGVDEAPVAKNSVRKDLPIFARGTVDITHRRP